MVLQQDERQPFLAEVDSAFRRDVFKGLGTRPRFHDGSTTGVAQSSLNRLPHCRSITQPEPSNRSFRVQ